MHASPRAGVLVAHQPAYLPWCGYFSRLLDAGQLVLLDHVQFAERGYQNRNYIRAADGGRLRLTVPVHRRFGQPISGVHIADDQPWAARHWRALTQAYSRAPHWDACAARLEPVYARPWTCLADLNITLTQALLDALGLPVTLLRSSAIAPAGASTAMLIDLCRRTGASVLRTGTGATSYLDHALLDAAGISVEVATYANPAYPQGGGPFTPRLSVLDLIASTGPAAADILRAGGACRPW
jgi:hypothetical protein